MHWGTKLDFSLLDLLNFQYLFLVETSAPPMWSFEQAHLVNYQSWTFFRNVDYLLYFPILVVIFC